MTDFANQLDLFNPRRHNQTVHIIGMGGIGSEVFRQVLGVGIRHIEIWDDDAVEGHNLPSQLIYPKRDLGKLKVLSAASYAEYMGYDDITLTAHAERVTPDTPLEGIVISGVDSMDSRKDIWQAIGENPLVELYLDGRIGGEQLTYFSAIPLDSQSMDDYAATLFEQEHAAQLLCGSRVICYTTAALAGFLVGHMCLFLSGRLNRNVVELAYDVPNFCFLTNQAKT